MLTSSDMSTPIMSRSAGCPLTDKVALVTMHCHMFLHFVLCNFINSYIVNLLSYSNTSYFYQCSHGDALCCL